MPGLELTMLAVSLALQHPQVPYKWALPVAGALTLAAIVLFIVRALSK
jgi:hypothetical protein